MYVCLCVYLIEFAEKNEAPNSWYWSFRLAVEHGYIDLTNNTEILHACDYDAPQNYLTGGDAVNGTDDGGMDDLTSHDFPPYSPLPPGQQFDTPFELNHTQKEIIDHFIASGVDGDGDGDGDGSVAASGLGSSSSSSSNNNAGGGSYVHISIIAVGSFLLGLMVQRFLLLDKAHPSKTSSSILSLRSFPNLPSMVTSTHGTYQHIHDNHDNDDGDINNDSNNDRYLI